MLLILGVIHGYLVGLLGFPLRIIDHLPNRTDVCGLSAFARPAVCQIARCLDTKKRGLTGRAFDFRAIVRAHSN
jgi:hypothetical protein